MSKWYEADLNDCFWDAEGETLNVYLYRDKQGAVYVEINKDIIKKAKKLPKLKDVSTQG